MEARQENWQFGGTSICWEVKLLLQHVFLHYFFTRFIRNRASHRLEIMKYFFGHLFFICSSFGVFIFSSYGIWKSSFFLHMVFGNLHLFFTWYLEIFIFSPFFLHFFFVLKDFTLDLLPKSRKWSKMKKTSSFLHFFFVFSSFVLHFFRFFFICEDFAIDVLPKWRKITKNAENLEFSSFFLRFFFICSSFFLRFSLSSKILQLMSCQNEEK